jgi:TRAP-type C4-dicarboxylate transport system permease small subunit
VPLSAVRTLDRYFGHLLSALAVAGAIVVLLMVGVVTADVVLRAVTPRGLPWSSDASEYGVYLVTLLTAPWLLRRGMHVAIDVLSSRVPGLAGKVLGKMTEAVIFVVCVAIAYYGWAMVAQSKAAESLVIKSVVFPEWIALAPLPVVFMLLAVESSLGIILGRSRPSATTMP